LGDGGRELGDSEHHGVDAVLSGDRATLRLKFIFVLVRVWVHKYMDMSA
jgi:hypothetical protein